MSTLKQQMAKLQEQITLSKQAGNAKHLIEDCNVIFGRLEQKKIQSEQAIRLYNTLKSLPEDADRQIAASTELREQIQTSQYLLQEFHSKWIEDNAAARNGDELANTESSFDRLIGLLNDESKECWRAWTDRLLGDTAIEDVLLERQKNIPGMESNCTNYVRRRQNLENLTRKPPADELAIDTLVLIRDELITFRSEMDHDLDDEVAEFFRCLNSKYERGVPLSLLTDKVFEWLKKHDYLEKFAITRRGVNF